MISIGFWVTGFELGDSKPKIWHSKPKNTEGTLFSIKKVKKQSHDKELF